MGAKYEKSEPNTKKIGARYEKSEPNLEKSHIWLRFLDFQDFGSVK